MPRIPNQYLKCAVYLYKSKEAAEKSEEYGGTGCLVGYKSADGYVHVKYVVTNRHVIEDGYTVIRLNTLAGPCDIFETARQSWIFHPEDDLAACAVSPNYLYHAFSVISTDLFVDKEKITKHNLGVGDEVFMVGRLVGHQGTLRNIPVARFGAIAMMPLEPLRNKYGNLRKHYLVEIRSVSGSSGSPVFIYDLPYAPEGVRNEQFGQFFLGVDCGHIPNEEQLLRSGIAVVIPASSVMELLNQPDLKDVRENKEKESAEYALKVRIIVPDSSTEKITKQDFEEALKKVSRKKI